MPKTPRPATHAAEYPPLEPDIPGLTEPDPRELSQQQLDDDFLDVFLPDDEAETLPEWGDFWIEIDSLPTTLED